jgi:hypothetical protein
MARSKPPMVSVFVSEITRQLRGKGPDLALALNWMEQQLSESGMTSAELIHAEIQKQSADQVSISNSIGSLRLLGAMDWREFVETHSIVEQTLLEDPEGIYGSMDFYTRDQYRHVVEQIARKSKLTEHSVARIAVQSALENGTTVDMDRRKAHVGYYLVGPGAQQTKKMAEVQEPVSQKIWQLLHRYNFKIYITAVLLITLAISAVILINAGLETKDNWILITIAFLSLLCTSQLAISVVNFFSTLLVKPHLLPRMDFSNTIPPNCRTMVVIPVMLTNEAEIENLTEALEVRFLANRKDNLHFALLMQPRKPCPEIRP